ncbi:MAG: response regulator [Geobacter sp.]|nr:response regulator [Geobacter sp.]
MTETQNVPELWLMGIGEKRERGDVIRGYLEEAGFRLRPATPDMLEKEKPRGIIMDISPFSSDGWGLILQLKGDPATRQIPILPVFLSETGKPGGIFPVSGFFLLPVDPDYVVKMLTVLGLTDETDTWDLQAFIISRNGEEQLGKLLQSLGFDVVKAYTGHEAVALTTTGAPYLAFCSMMLPDMSAFELLEKLRLYPRTKNVPFFVMMKGEMKEGEKLAMSKQIEHLVRKKQLSKEEFLAHFRRRG